MASIIEQIQRDALDADVRVSDLLRRVKLAATKLGLGAVEDWVEQELSGYKDASLPEYRIIHFPFSDSLVAKLNETNGTHGWSAALEVDRSASARGPW
jgi:hypothetical protein